MLSIHIDNPPIHSDDLTDITPSLDYIKELGTNDKMSTDAIFNLAICYYNGKGTEKNLEKSFYWHQKAAENRHTDNQTAFLLALVTASRPSDLKKVNVTTIKSSSSGYTLECRDPKEYKIVRSHSLSTSKSSAKKLYVGQYEEDSI
ncbi:hypothetical protein RhiirA1_56212 [Rhizophagus irregularis]|uniref:HCP-like protein n=4 Tax=Rhizophagus irregularis TaxID=588596 RepID=A0A2N1MRL4_9GLOM|nr:hypothetical protein RirG_019090 [Rhizophagus irregularis DAOM 197198w]PKC58625.1 hypothetical protein RhiirA1_56212 [Rhizophagus irregularis]GBC16534.1 kinase-like domain-containing protein [Rhizophagus irregularis DAOM 181602=DAOM 197198]PKK64279.1 hypothetical protein RhiirC2_787729 [Rhizophagus irregularis]UZO06340.1 hypothetical protein OCT59_026666 [Rhizophagus irregularis]